MWVCGHNVARTVGQRLTPTHVAHCVFSGVLSGCNWWIASNSGPSHSGPSDMNRFKSAEGEAGEPAFAHPRSTSVLRVTRYGFHVPLIWRGLQVNIVHKVRLCFDTQSDECSVLSCARGR